MGSNSPITPSNVLLTTAFKYTLQYIKEGPPVLYNPNPYPYSCFCSINLTKTRLQGFNPQ